jgi:hypothetical protein
MFLAHGQRITFTSNPKLIISVLILILLLLSLKSLSNVASTRHTALNLACLLEVGQQAWCTILKFTYQEQPTSSSYDPQASGTGTDFPSTQAQVLVSPSLCWALHKQEMPSIFFPTKKQKKLLLMSYVQGPLSNNSSTKCRVLHSSDLSSQCQICYKGYVQ